MFARLTKPSYRSGTATSSPRPLAFTRATLSSTYVMNGSVQRWTLSFEVKGQSKKARLGSNYVAGKRIEAIKGPGVRVINGFSF